MGFEPLSIHIASNLQTQGMCLIGYCSGCAGSVDFSDSDEEDENIAGVSDNGGLSSFPVDSWEDTWDDSDAPVSQEVRCSSPPPTLC